MTPEAQARQIIDQKLIQAGWLIQDYRKANLGAGLGIAVREHPGIHVAEYLTLPERQLLHERLQRAIDAAQKKYVANIDNCHSAEQKNERSKLGTKSLELLPHLTRRRRGLWGLFRAAYLFVVFKNGPRIFPAAL